MAFKPDKKKMEQHVGGEYKEETCVVPEGDQLCRFIHYAELGMHHTEYSGKRKPPALMIKLGFEYSMAEHTGNFPLMLFCTDRAKSGTWLNVICASEKLLNGEMSLEFANKTSYMKVLNAMNKAAGEEKESIADHLGTVFLSAVTHAQGAKDKVYANFKAAELRSCIVKHPVKGTEEDYSTDMPEAGNNTVFFEWDNPDPEEWKKLKPWDKKAIKDALDFPGSPVSDMLIANPDLDIKDEKEQDDPEDSDDHAEVATAFDATNHGVGSADEDNTVEEEVGDKQFSDDDVNVDAIAEEHAGSVANVPDTVDLSKGVDADGVYHDTRIHSSSFGKTAKGNWKMKRGVAANKSLVDQVKKELAQIK